MKILFVVFFNLLIVISYGQVIFIDSYTSSEDNFDYKKHTGVITLNNGDTIAGTFLYAYWEFPTFNLKYYSNDIYKQKYLFPIIKKAVFRGGDDFVTTGDSTVFAKVPGKDKYLYRQLTFGDIKIYDQFFLVDEEPGRVSKDLIIIYQGHKYKTETNEELLSLVEKLKPGFAAKLKNKSRQEIIRQLNNNL